MYRKTESPIYTRDMALLSFGVRKMLIMYALNLALPDVSFAQARESNQIF
jgi:hypothetical protein